MINSSSEIFSMPCTPVEESGGSSPALPLTLSLLMTPHIPNLPLTSSLLVPPVITPLENRVEDVTVFPEKSSARALSIRGGLPLTCSLVPTLRAAAEAPVQVAATPFVSETARCLKQKKDRSIRLYPRLMSQLCFIAQHEPAHLLECLRKIEPSWTMLDDVRQENYSRMEEELIHDIIPCFRGTNEEFRQMLLFFTSNSLFPSTKTLDELVKSGKGDLAKICIEVAHVLPDLLTLSLAEKNCPDLVPLMMSSLYIEEGELDSEENSAAGLKPLPDEAHIKATM